MPQGDAIVILGISGDLARRDLIPSLYWLAAHDRLAPTVVGVARSIDGDGHLRDHVSEIVHDQIDDVDDAVVARLHDTLAMVTGDYTDAATYDGVRERLDGARNPVFHTAVPEFVFAEAVEGIAQSGAVHDGHVLVEKPIGEDLKSSRELSARLESLVGKRALLRIDHFLGMPAVHQILALRFGNRLFEAMWSREHVASVDIVLAEDFGVEDRGGFYDATGALNDVVQSHLLQVLALLLMEPPGDGPDAMRDARAQLLASVAPVQVADATYGQYDGYLDIDGVAEGSQRETFAGLSLDVQAPRWAGVPVRLMTGKQVATKTKQAVLTLKPAGGAGLPGSPVPTRLRVVLDGPGALEADVVVEPNDLELGVRHAAVSLGAAQQAQPPYAHIYEAALRGDTAHFTRQDEVEDAWRIVGPLVADPPAPQRYAPGSWGPGAAGEALRGVLT